MILIDARPLREKARRAYEKVLRDLDKAREEMERFEKQDKPGFTTWLNRQFGALLTELRKVSQNLQNQRELFYEIESEACRSDCSHVMAYERVMWRKEHPEEAAEEARREEENDPWAGFGDQTRPGEFQNEFESFFSEIAEEFDRMFGGRNADRNFPPASPPPRTASGRLKELYRAVVRRLHPDAQGQMTWQKKEWWHQAQAAYQSGDAEQLQVILTLCELDDQGITATTSVSLLTRVTAEFKRTLRSLKSQIKGQRQDPAWNFTALDDRSGVACRMERKLRAELLEAQEALHTIEAQLAMWARQAQLSRARRPRRQRRARPEFFF